MYEAALAFRGDGVDYGNGGSIRSVAGSRVGGAIDSPLYLSPITDACGKNFIILLTDGEPSGDTSANDKITALPGYGTAVGTGCDGTGEGRCLDDVAAYLLRQDLNDSLPGLQNVVTHTIGFEVDFPLLVNTAARGGGEYHLADDTATLATALSGIVLSIFDNTGTFAAPAVPVNSFNRTQNLSDVFISVFQPTDTARWLGNLKRYRLDDGVLVGQVGTECAHQPGGHGTSPPGRGQPRRPGRPVGRAGGRTGRRHQLGPRAGRAGRRSGRRPGRGPSRHGRPFPRSTTDAVLFRHR
jgi:type IV pilus assembly protein PilY1